MMRRIVLLFAAAALAAFSQAKYDGPRPPKPDVPYLKHASDLVSTEIGQAREEKQKNDTLYVVDGAASPARTPMASPIFLMVSEKIVPDRLGLYKLDVKNGHREILFGQKKQPRPIRIEVSRVAGNLFRIEVDESLDPGEYSLSPTDSNTVFCFQVY